MGIELFNHQKELLVKAKDRPYYAMLWQPGLGKTLGVLKLIEERKARNPRLRVLYVCPATLIENVQDEVQKFTKLTALSVVGSKKHRLIILDRPADIYIINYEGMRILDAVLAARKFDLVVFDESHALKNHTSLQSKAGFRVAMSCPQRIIMTGTPISQNPLDLFGQYRCLSPDIFGMSYFQFRSRYAILGGWMGKQVVKFINQDTLKQKALSCADYRTKQDCLDLPPQLYETVRVDMIPEQVRMYKSLKEQFIASCKDQIVTAPVMLTRLMRFSQITAGFFKTVEGKEVSYDKNPKLDWLVEWLRDTGQKTIVFVRFIKEREDAEARLTKEGIKFVSIQREDDDRIERVKKFNENKDIQVFLTSISLGGTGINLQSASYSIFLSNEYSYGKREQAEGRTHRAGQQAQNCTYIDVVARGTVDESIIKIIKKKEDMARLLVTDLVRMV